MNKHMNTKIKKRWIKALTSGRFEQGRGQLKTVDNKFCCLGVLCQLHMDTVNKTRKRKVMWVENKWGELCYNNEQYELPKAVSAWAGIPGERNPKAGDMDLAKHNDGNSTDNIKPKSFKKIAKLIEKYL